MKVVLDGNVGEVAGWLRRAGVEVELSGRASNRFLTASFGRVSRESAHARDKRPEDEVATVRVGAGSSVDERFDFATESAIAAACFIISRVVRMPAPLLTGDEAMFAAVGQVCRNAERRTGILLVGETGTGKELLARLAHGASGRAGAFVALNCATLADDELEAQMLGDDPGALNEGRQGYLRLARGGTLVLDHLDGLLALASEHLGRIIGRHAPGAMLGEDVRYVGSSTRAPNNPQRAFFEAAAGEAPVEIMVPPLRARSADVRLLALHFMRLANSALAFGEDALEALARHRFPGNVRELSNLVTQLAFDPAVADRGRVTAADLSALGAASPSGGSRTSRVRESGWRATAARIFESCAGTYPQTIGGATRRQPPSIPQPPPHPAPRRRG